MRRAQPRTASTISARTRFGERRQFFSRQKYDAIAGIPTHRRGSFQGAHLSSGPRGNVIGDCRITEHR
jgi:hypothetical protein